MAQAFGFPEGLFPYRFNYLMVNNHHKSGFGFSRTDGLVIAVCAATTCLLWRLSPQMALLFPIVLGHFFLFCNVFRIRRNAEFLWSAFFLGNTSLWFALESFSWAKVLALQTPITILLIANEMRHRDYHGIFSKQLNRNHFIPNND